MPPLTGKTPGNGTGTLSYTIPGAGLDVESVYAVVDASGAGGAVTAELTITDQSGVVIARKVQNSTIDAGVAGSATWALQLLDDCVTGPTSTFAQTVLTVAPTGTLRGYWRLGETASPFADSSGWASGPTPLSVHATGTAYTPHVTGALPFGQDEGALQFNSDVANGYYINNGLATINTGINAGFSICAWVKPSASGLTIFGGVYSNSTQIAGAPSHIEGWGLAVSWSGGATVARMRRVIADVPNDAGVVIPVGSWSFLVGTYDGANLRLYLNGALSATKADARADTFDPYSTPNVCFMPYSIANPPGQFFGVLDEIALWGTTLSATDVATLYASALI